MKTSKLTMYTRVRIISLIFLSVFGCSLKIGAADKPLIFPVPQNLQVTTDNFVLDESVAIIIPLKSTDKDNFLARNLVRELSDKYDVSIKIEARADIPKGRKTVVMGSIENPLVKKYCTDNNLELTSKSPGPEGYIMDVNSNLIVIGGSDDAGAFYGLQSLRQLLINSEQKLKIQGLKVRDWPSLPFRGVRLYIPGPENVAFFKRFLKDFMALYKYNKVIVELNCMRLDKHPEVNAGWIEFSKYMQYTRSNETKGVHGENKNSTHYDAGDGYIIEKDAVKDVVDYSNQNFIEVIPEIPTLTHCYYLLTRHPELAEYPGDRWPDTYCPSNPKTYELMFDVYDEYIDVIKPKMVHIGHDEWWGAPIGVCPLCKDNDRSVIFAQDVSKIHDYFAKKGIKIAMWGDFLLESVRHAGPVDRTSTTGLKYKTPGAVRPEIVQSSIPKDILIFNWFYSNQERDMELQKFGFKQVYGNFTPSISNWDDRIKKIDLVGGAPSSWTATNESNFGKDLVSDFLGCSSLLWSSRPVSQPDLAQITGALMPSIRASLKAVRIPSTDGDIVEPVDISSLYNLPKDSKLFGMNLGTLKSGDIQLGKKVFNLASPEKASGKCAIVVSTVGTGENPFPATVGGIPVNEDISSLIFLQACALPSGNQDSYYNIPDNFDSSDLLGWYEIVYEDGFKSIVPIQYGVNILEWNSGGAVTPTQGRPRLNRKGSCYNADPIVCSTDPNANPITFFSFEWVNPRFGKVIKEVNMYGSVNYKALQRNFDMPTTRPMASNAVMLTGINKVKKRDLFIVK